MLQVKDVRKKYVTGNYEQIALNGVSLNLRDNEFVAILGPSGSGKTTLLNIIGGLDRYDSGDLIINGVSTKKYKDRDWDSYRNHTVGFVFQSYNLIPHQTVLANVELALTIGGISGARRRQMALDALEQVGLREQAHKKPNQMSGGQMQRVAIARALVNNPKILLADEPTGALDTKTSVQVMDLLKEVAKDRLVVMVTHNPELAEQYANRIVRVKDGNLVDDTHPLVIEEETPSVHRNLGKASMSLLTSFALSMNNLMTKKGRTFLTAFAGSIGIIGIALILSLSTGFQNYIDQIQEETMTSYPLTIYEESSNALAAILTMHSENDENAKENTLVEQQYIATMMGSISKNDLEYFREYLNDHEDEYIDNVSKIKYSYSVTPLIYTVDAADNLAQINPNAALTSYMGTSSTSYLSTLSGSSSMTSSFSEITDLDDMKANYELLAGKWPEKYNEMIAVVSDPNQISDLLLYSLGFRDTKELKTLIADVMSGETVETSNEQMVITYDDLMNVQLKLINPTDLYRYNEDYGTYEDMSDDEDYMQEVYDNSEDLKITGIAWSSDNTSSMSAGVMYLPELTYHVIEEASDSEIVKKQLADKDVDVFSGKEFGEEDDTESGLDFEDMISIDEDKIADAFQTNIDTSSLSGLGSVSISMDTSSMSQIIMAASTEVAENLETVTKSLVPMYTQLDTQVADAMISGYTSAMTVELPEAIGNLTAKDLINAGFSAEDLLNAGISSTDLAKAGLSASDFAAAATGTSGGTGSLSVNTAGTSAGAESTPANTAETSAGAGSASVNTTENPAGAESSEGNSAGSSVSAESAAVNSGSEAAISASAESAAASTGAGNGESYVSAASVSEGSISAGSGDSSASAESSSSGTDNSAAAAESSSVSGTDASGTDNSSAASTGIDFTAGADSTSGTSADEGSASGSGADTSAGEGSTSGTSAGTESSSAGSEDSAGENVKYLVVNSLTLNAYKKQAMTDEIFETLASQMSSAMGDTMSVDSTNMQTVVSDAYDIYFDEVKSKANILGLIPVSQLPDPSESIAKAMEKDAGILFKESYDQAKTYTVMLVAAGMGEAVTNVVTPMMSGITSSLSGLSALSSMFSGDILTIDQDKFAEAFQFDMDEDELSRLMESMLTSEDASYSGNLMNLGYQDLDSPTSIAFYFKDFESKGNFTDWLENYNDTQDEDKQLSYTDVTGLLMGSVETIVNSVTYVLIAFVSISLIVSCIMIGIITYISVLERTKEIGILRAIGASKHNISSIFNAETFIIGFLSGLIGIGSTYLLNIPINMVIHNVTGNPDITAVLNPVAAGILVIISTVLTMFGGLIPSKSASRKDPVIALRTE